MLRVWRIVLHAVALKMAAWSKAILQRLEASGPEGASTSIDVSTGEPIESSSPLPSSTDEVGIESTVTEPDSGGPPAHWLERVRQGAPELLRSVLQRDKRTRPAPSSAPPLAEKAAALPQVGEDQREKPSYPLGPLGEKELAPQWRPAVKPAKPAVTRVASSISQRPTSSAPPPTEKATELPQVQEHHPEKPSFPLSPSPAVKPTKPAVTRVASSISQRPTGSAPPLAEKATALPQVQEHQPEKPSYPLGPSGAKELAPQWPPAVKPTKPAVTRVASSISQRPTGSAPPLAEKATALPQVQEHQPEKPSYPLSPSGAKELAPQWPPAVKPAKQAETGVSSSISQRPTQHTEPAYPATPPQNPSTGVPVSRPKPKVTPQPFLSPARPQSSSSAALAKFPPERVEESPKSLHVSPAPFHIEPVPNRSAGSVERSSGPSREPLWATAPPPPAHPEATFAPQRTQRRAASLSYLEGPAKAALAAGSLSIQQEPSEDHWPELPETAPADPLNEPLATIRKRERLRRLDEEQRGIYGTRRISA